MLCTASRARLCVRLEGGQTQTSLGSSLRRWTHWSSNRWTRPVYPVRNFHPLCLAPPFLPRWSARRSCRSSSLTAASPYERSVERAGTHAQVPTCVAAQVQPINRASSWVPLVMSSEPSSPWFPEYGELCPLSRRLRSISAQQGDSMESTNGWSGAHSPLAQDSVRGPKVFQSDMSQI